MTHFHIQWLSDAAEKTGVELTKLPKANANIVFGAIRFKFADPHTQLPAAAVWHSLVPHESCPHENGWLDICEYVGESEAYLCVQHDESAGVFVFTSGNDLKLLLSECPSFEFYVANLLLDYLLCFNDHDYLIGCGTAADWVKRRCKSLT